ncbi:MAG: hypothetical protein RIG68_23900 [Imperialibacter sp.]|uniref:hypothetical protein n=1 Tax=Imperialibacter sp. TaxID=2038411 RepID=UPI0032ECF7C9
MNLLKRLMMMTMVGGTMVWLASCNNEEDGLNDDATASAFEDVAVDTEASMDVAFEDVDNVVEAGINYDEASGGKVLRDPLIECAVVTHDHENNKVIIDYGDGCEGDGGRTRSGKIIVTYSDIRWFAPGATRSVTFEDFYIDSVKVEGVRTITNITADESSTPQFKTQLAGGKLIWNDGTFATRDSEHTRTWARAENPAQDESFVEGSAEGQNRDGEAYSSTITERLVFKRRCGAQGYFFPVSGVIETIAPGATIVIDYGDGECDNLAEVTINGETKTIELDVRARREVVRRRLRG